MQALTLSHRCSGDSGPENGLLDRLAVQQEYPGMLKGSEPLKTCTFGCVYCPTEVDEAGEQVLNAPSSTRVECAFAIASR